MEIRAEYEQTDAEALLAPEQTRVVPAPQLTGVADRG
jgi:hypothetical protein